MAEVVAHPETGKPSVVVKNYQELELTQIEADLTNKETELEASRTGATQANETVARLEAELEDLKSLEAGYHAVAPRTELESETEAASSEHTDEVAPTEEFEPTVSF